MTHQRRARSASEAGPARRSAFFPTPLPISLPVLLLASLLAALLTTGCGPKRSITGFPGGSTQEARPAPQQAEPQRPRTVTLSTPYDSKEARRKLAPGKNTIRGTASARTPGGEVATCAGKPVTLVPVTAYSDERMFAIYGSDDKGVLRLGQGAAPPPVITNDDPRYLADHPQTVCTDSGTFVFKDIADGQFFIVTGFTWLTEDKKPQGVGLMQRVSVSGGQTRKLDMKP
ncbi:hypothetical protein [Nitratidesulfovibrio sp. SRB-5]|uniref:hypothetical protein n=1 Tax=Nitratidesulfovibrio sp. SRB-5 TaxID=2872636 RepID=UPI001026DEF5|nr:hypothetical protein [Nitratidesulfovibrio sp. SRB-5]MBZ2171582.1 hypothetical protein [Nitratidesulfovibrio sp. SRB-5]RXF78107.1 hypothetical protein EKK70_03450 [Desulfovibrio sp. DS-1]